MHFDFHFNANQILWTLTFASLLVLLVVLLGRDRIYRFPWFTAGIALVALRLLTTRILIGRMQQTLGLNAFFIVLADVGVVVSILVLVELARRAFSSAGRRAWMVWTLALVAVGGLVLAYWGAWPSWKTITAESQLAALRLMQLVAEKGQLLVSVLTVELGLLAVVFGRRYKAGWRSHTQQILIGFSTAAISQLSVQCVWQIIAKTAKPQSQAEYDRIVGLGGKLLNANNVVYLAVLIWWIVCLWIDEPGTAAPAVPHAEFLVAEFEPAELPSEVETEPAAELEEPSPENVG
jgi:hypothetical protein